MEKPNVDPLRYFDFEHLPVDLQPISAQFKYVADWVIHYLPSGPERTAAIRKLLEAKDCAVRSALDLREE